MNFNSVIQTNSSTPLAPGAKPSGMLGQKDFLRLLTAQMQTQDPFDPVDNKEMLAQMAQFSSLAGLSEINDTLGAINDKLAAGAASDAALLDTLQQLNAKLTVGEETPPAADPTTT